MSSAPRDARAQPTARQNIMEGIVKLDSEHDDRNGAPAYLVPYDHPVTAYFNKALKENGRPCVGEMDLVPGKRMFVAKSSDMDTCIEALLRDARLGQEESNN